jgi:hypothetical protein
MRSCQHFGGQVWYDNIMWEAEGVDAQPALINGLYLKRLTPKSLPIEASSGCVRVMLPEWQNIESLLLCKVLEWSLWTLGGHDAPSWVASWWQWTAANVTWKQVMVEEVVIVGFGSWTPQPSLHLFTAMMPPHQEPRSQKRKRKQAFRSSANSRARIATTTTARQTLRVVIFIAEQDPSGVLGQVFAGAALLSCV